MEWLEVISRLLGDLAWPVSLLIFLAIFRREIKQRLTAVTEVKYPGGSITMREIERLEARVEEVTAPTSASRRVLGSGSPPYQQTDSRLAIAQMRLDTEKELFLLARHGLHHNDATVWPVGRYIDELERGKILDAALTDNVRNFVELANKIVHEMTAPENLVERAAAIGGSLVASLHHKRLVLEAVDDFGGHGLWHMHGHTGSEDAKYYFWSAVASSLPEFDYDYDVYLEAIELHNKRVEKEEHPGRKLYVLSLEEFVAVLEFKEKELQRLIHSFGTSKSWDSIEKEDNYWQWPSEWGHLGWNCPIVRERFSLWRAQEDLMRTRAASAFYCQRQLALRRAEAR